MVIIVTMTGEDYPEPELVDEEAMDPRSARLALEAANILSHPAVRPLIDIDMEERESLGQTKALAAQKVLEFMMVQHVIGNFEDMSSQEIMDTRVADGALSVSLHAVNQFHNAFIAYARIQHKTGRQQAQDIINGDVNGNIEHAVIDLANLFQRGLLDADGENLNLQYAGHILRFINVNLLFSGQLETQERVNQFYDQLYQTVTGELITAGRLNHSAADYANQYGQPVTRGSVIRNMRRKAGPLVGDITNRAALMVLLGNAKGSLGAVEDPGGTRMKYAKALRAIGRAEDIEPLNTSIVSLIGELYAAAEAEVALSSDEFAEDVTQAMQLDWEVLPPGELEERARKIVSDQQRTRAEVFIDLERLKILDKIRTEWGEDACYYAYGKLGKRRVIKRDGQEEPDQYLMLILQEFDRGGNVVREHAVAESPIAGPNALYVFRQDVSEGLSWREVMALPKSYARALKARAVKHSKPRQAPEGFLIASMTKKVSMLLACEVDEFLAIEFSGERGIRLPKDVVQDPPGK